MQPVAYLMWFDDLGLFYVGSTSDLYRRSGEHFQRLEQGLHSNRRVQEAFGRSRNISFEVHPTETREAAYRKEQELLSLHLGNPRLLNNEHIVRFVTSETTQKISQTLTGHTVNEETRRKLSEIHSGNQYWLGKKHKPETIEKLGKHAIGNTYAVGHSKTPEGIERIRQANLGRIKSEEELRLISQNHATRREVNIAGVRYYNTKEAAEALGISYQTVRRRCLDPLFPEYFFEE